ncbi:MAG TPA: BON domain-containing protein [Candidatus Limnocylindrales bacterium]|nr:BON domain-containing protein [Candidatus Limnocylindrales bacterium]
MKFSALLLRCKNANFLALLLFIAAASALSSALQVGLQVIPERSQATAFLGSAENPKSFRVGEASVSGELLLNPNDISASHISLKIHESEKANPVRLGPQSGPGYHSVITFESYNVQELSGGKLQAQGRMTVLQVVDIPPARNGGPDPEASIGSPKTHASREVTFVFGRLEQSASALGVHGGQGRMWVRGNTVIDGDAFPELSFSIQDVARSTPLDAANCINPTSPDEEDDADRSCLFQSQDREQPPAGNVVTILLNLALAGAPVVDTSAQEMQPRQPMHQNRTEINGRILSNLETAFDSDPVMTGSDLSVEVDDINIIISGSVQSFQQHQRALELTSTYYRYRNVIDRMSIQ